MTDTPIPPAAARLQARQRLPWPSWYAPPPKPYHLKTRLSPDAVVREACYLIGISVTEFMGECKAAKNTEARQAVTYVIHRRRPDLSWPQIARKIGRKDHTTAMHAFRAAQTRMAKSPEFTELVLKLEALQ